MLMKIVKLNIKQRITDNLTWFVWMSFMTFSITYMIIYALTFKYSPIKLCVMTMLALSVWAIVLMNKVTMSMTLVLLIILGIGESAYLYKQHMLNAVLGVVAERIISFASWSIRCIAGYPAEGDLYISYFVLILCFMIAAVTYFFTIKRFRFLVLCIGGAFIFVFEVTQKRPISLIALYLFIFTSLMYFFKSRYFSLKQELDDNDNNFDTYKAFMKISMSVGAGIFICSVLLANIYPYKSKWLHGLVDTFARKQYYYAADNFSVESAGLQEDDGLLGGDISLKDILVLKVETPSPTYLKAISKDTYTGSAWKSTEEEHILIDLKREKLIDTVETIEGIKWLSGDENSLDALFNKNKASIRFINITTKSLFIPPKMASFNITSFKRDVFLVHLDSLSLEKAARKNFTYSTEYYEPDYTNNQFKEVIRKSKIGFYNEIKDKYPSDTERINKWAEHAESITRHYTQIPEELPKRVGELARAITKGKTNNYDSVKAIEEYLTAHYQYTLKPGKVEAEEDFVDQFLFENKKGYCTYFASALALLTRSIGIPCRYAEGYVLPNTLEQNETFYRVTNKRAHAWVEVYFEGMGWILFEATPPYRHVETAGTNGLSMEEAMRNGQGAYTGNGNVLTFKKGKIFNIYGMIPGIFLIGIIAGILILYKDRRYRFEKMNSRDAILYLYKNYLDLLALQKLFIEAGETERIFADRVDKLMSFRGSTFKAITELFLVARYSQLELTDKDKEKVLDFKYQILETSRKKINILGYITCKIKYKFL